MLKSNILYDNLSKKIKITHANHSATSKAILTKTLVQFERLFFYLSFVLGIIHGDRCDRKTPKTFFYLSKTHLVVEASNTVTLKRNARFDVILTSVTIIKQGFHSQIVML